MFDIVINLWSNALMISRNFDISICNKSLIVILGLIFYLKNTSMNFLDFISNSSKLNSITLSKFDSNFMPINIIVVFNDAPQFI